MKLKIMTNLFRQRNCVKSSARVAGLSAFLSIVLMALFSINAEASHYRYGNISYTWVSGRTVTFHISQSYRRSFYPGPPNVGNTASTETFQFGDGATQPIVLTITSVNATDDWFYGEATITHTYAGTGTLFTAFYASNARLSTLLNNANGNYRSEAKVTIGSNNSSPVSTSPPIVNVPAGQSAATFQLAANDPDGHSITYRLATPTEMGATNLTQPTGLSINSTTGLVTFNTTGKSIGQLYNAAFVVTDQLGATTMVDVLLQMVQQSTPPAFDYSQTPANGTVYNIQPGQNLSFNVRAIDIDPGNTVVLSAVGLPTGSTTSPSLPVTASGSIGAATSFSWTPANNQLGTRIISFSAQDNLGNQTSSTVTIITSLNPVFDVPPTLASGSFNCLETGTLFTTTIQAHAPDALVNLNISSATSLTGVLYSPSIPTTSANTSSTVMSWTPPAAAWGVHNFTFTATDDLAHSTNHSYDLAVNTAPSFTSTQADVTITENQPFSYNVSFADADVAYGDVVDVVASSLPSWLTLVQTGPTTATVSGTPGSGDVGTHSVEIELEDVYHHCHAHVEQAFEIEVAPCTFVASITSSASGTVCPGSSVTLTANTADSYSWSEGSSTQSIVVAANGSTNYTVTSVSGYCTSSATVTVTGEDNDAPQLSGVPADATVSCDAIPSIATVTATDNCTTNPAVSSFSFPAVNAGATHLWSGNNTTNDAIGSANASVAYGSINYGASVIGDGFVLNGSTGLNAGTAGSISGTGDFSVSAWIRTTSNNGMTVVQQRDADIAGQYILKIGTNHNGADYNPGKVYFLVGGAVSFGEIYSTTNVNDGQWHHVAGERSGTAINIYIDGVLNATGSAGSLVNMNQNGNIRTFIGYDERNVQFGANANFFAGNIDEVRLMVAGNCASNRQINNVWTATDASGNSATEMQTVIVQDLTAPVISTPADIAISNDAGACAAVVTFSAMATDNCGTASVSYSHQSGSSFSTGTTAVTVTATDNCGNSSTSTFNVTVNDTELPTITAPANVTVNGYCQPAPADLGTPTTADNCGVASVVSNAPSLFPVGTTTVTWTVTDVHGNQATAQQTVTVNPGIPTISGTTTNVSCYNGTTGAIDITVANGAAPYTYLWNGGSTSEDRTGLSAGTYSVTATDAHACSVSGTYTLTQPAAALAGAVSVSPNPTVAGQQAYTIFLGYGPQSVTLSASASGGTSGYTYNWMPGNTTGSTATVSPTVTTTYTVTITDANGCTVAVTRTIFVKDVRDGNKIFVCHIPPGNPGNPQLISVSSNAVPAHLGHGDNLGACNSTARTMHNQEGEEDGTVAMEVEALHFHVYPNPTNGVFTIELPKTGTTDVIITDVAGKVIVKRTIKDNAQQQLQYNLGNEARGLYFIRVVNGGEVFQSKITLE